MRPFPIFAVLLAASLSLPHAASAGEAASNVPTVPGDDIFGYTAATDPGNPGDQQFFNENDGRVGKRQGSYFALDSKFAYDKTFAPEWWGSVGVFTNLNVANGLLIIPDISEFRFDGGALEIERRILQRSASNPFAVSLDVEADFNLHDPETGLPAESLSATFKVFVDAPITPEKLYWAANLQYQAGSQQAPGSGPWAPFGQALASTALTWRFSDAWFAGAEVRYFANTSAAFSGQLAGEALYAGPTLLWKPSETWAFNVTLQPQLWGRAVATPGESLDLVDFERANFRLKAVASF